VAQTCQCTPQECQPESRHACHVYACNNSTQKAFTVTYDFTNITQFNALQDRPAYRLAVRFPLRCCAQQAILSPDAPFLA